MLWYGRPNSCGVGDRIVVAHDKKHLCSAFIKPLDKKIKMVLLASSLLNQTCLLGVKTRQTKVNYTTD